MLVVKESITSPITLPTMSGSWDILAISQKSEKREKKVEWKLKSTTQIILLVDERSYVELLIYIVLKVSFKVKCYFSHFKYVTFNI